MRKFSAAIALVFAVACFSPVSSPANAAAPKPGTTCKSLNQKVTSGGQIYTCIKSGSKKVWSKGVKVEAKATTSPAPSVPAPTTSPKPITIQEGIVCDLSVLASGRDVNGKELYCTKGGDGVYSWRPKQTEAPAPTPSSTPTNQPAKLNIEEGIICDINQSATGKDANGRELYCLKSGDGKYVWNSKQNNTSTAGSGSGSGSNSSGTSQQVWPYALGKLGTKCTKEGQVAWNGYVVGACKNGIVMYAMQKDIPATPAGGYQSRPDWYPTLNQIMMPPNQPEPTCAPSTIKFTKPVIPLDKLAPTIPYGMMVGDHVTPIDHAYLGHTALSIPQASRTANDYIPITAPADGVITELGSLGSSSSHRVVINHGCNVFSVYMVLNKGTGVLADAFSKLNGNGFMSLNIPIKAGEEFGRQRDNMLDFNVFDGTKFLSGFANVYSYLSGDTWKPYTTDYLPFFTEDIRSAMEKQLQRTSSPRIGKIDQDVIGSAAGNWFLAGTNGYGGNLASVYENAVTQVMGGSVAGKNFYAWSHFAIAKHEVDTSKWILSTGWYQDPNGDAMQFVINLGADQPAPDKLTPSSGPVVYQLSQYSYLYPVGTPARVEGANEPYPVGYTLSIGAPKATVVLQVNSDNSLSVEFGSAFTSAKRTYTR